ncbi:hypothetical protein ANANG_G00201030 [Anguilla anguilla]|uniref:Uncharacterized protein n=1 Tax=Anguilla anguilla TaxID=7936 RepID=A0A9D3RQ58_ANGAN|nr:hypothetical protein ANANG_G00201030 [Anguilla anguilla]
MNKRNVCFLVTARVPPLRARPADVHEGPSFDSRSWGAQRTDHSVNRMECHSGTGVAPRTVRPTAAHEPPDALRPPSL